MKDHVFFQKYKYIRPLGQGGCGEVYLVENIVLGNYWAVKEIKKDSSASISGYIEPEILKRLNHPALPRICDVHESETMIYMVEDYIDGVCLKQELDDRGKFEEQNVIDWGIQLCSVLDYLHKQSPDPIVYGDMKPHNIILTREGYIKLIDFGVSQIKHKSEIDKSQNHFNNCSITEKEETMFIGTKGYAAPEQYLGAGVSQFTDIYSLGITLIQLISGIDPINCTQAYYNKEYKEHMSPDLARVLEKCTEANPQLRYQDVFVLMRELQELSLKKTVGSSDINSRSNTNLTKIYAFAGAAGAGASTLTAAIAEYVSNKSQRVCIADLSNTHVLEKSLLTSCNSSNPQKISSNLYYVNLSGYSQSSRRTDKNPDDLTDITYTADPLILYKQLAQLQDQFSFIFVDADLPILKMIEQYANHIFLVCDMNPYNIAELGDSLAAEKLTLDCPSGVSFIINKFYRGELSSSRILQSILINSSSEEKIKKLVSLSRTYEVPYDERIYLGWMYSGFGEPLRFNRLFSVGFEASISQMVSKTILASSKKPLSRIRQLINGMGG